MWDSAYILYPISYMGEFLQPTTYNLQSEEKGYIALILVFIISAVVILIATSASLASISESNMGLQENHSWEAFYLAMACTENALMSLKDDLNYEGDETLTFDNGTCTIEPLEGTGNQDRTIKVSGTSSGQMRKIKIEIDTVNPDMEIRSWQQVVEF